MPINQISVATESIDIDTVNNTYTASGSIGTQGSSSSVNGTITLTANFVYPPGTPAQSVVLGTVRVVNGVIQPPEGTGGNNWTVSGAIPPGSPLADVPVGTSITLGVGYSGSGNPSFNPSNNITTEVTCFTVGTLIRTPVGDVPVESLSPGDLVLTADGRAEPVLFVGRQAVSRRFGNAETRDPILIRAGALGETLPERDLRVSPHHAIVLDGVLCFAQALVNGTTILQIPAPAESFEYFSVELTRHEVIIAEGQPVESFSDHVPRERFTNHADFVALFPNGREVGEMDLPHAKSRRQVPAAILARIEARAAAIGATTDQAAA